MNNQQAAPFKLKDGDGGGPQAEDSSELFSEVDGTSDTVGKECVSLLEKGTATRDRIGIGMHADPTSDGEAESNIHAIEHSSLLRIERPTETAKKGGGISENDTTSSSTSAASMLGQAVQVAPPSAGLIPLQASLLQMSSQPELLSLLLQAQQTPGAPLNNASLLNQLSYLRHFPHIAQTQAQAQAQAQPCSLQLSLQALSLLNQFGSSSQAQRTPVNASLLNQAGFTHVPQAQAQVQSLQSSLQASLVAQLLQNLEPLAQKNMTRLPHIHQVSSSVHTPILNHHTVAQINQTATFPPTQPAPAPANMDWLQRLFASQNTPSFIPVAPPPSQSLIFQNLTQNMLKDQLVSLLSQQQTGVSNINSIPVAQMAAPANHLDSLLRSIATGSGLNSNGTSQGTSYATASTYRPLQYQSDQNTRLSVASGAISNPDSERSTVDTTGSELATLGHLHAPHQSREKQWMMRYEELSQFQKKHGHCRVPHGYAENRKLSWWVMNQRAQFQLLKHGKKNWLSEDRLAMLNAIGFDWSPISGK